MYVMPNLRSCLALSLALVAVPQIAAAEGYVFRAKAAVIAGNSGSAPPVAGPTPPTVGENGYAGKLDGRDVWVSSDERIGSWAAFGPEGAFHSGGSSRDDGKVNTEAQLSHARSAENLATQFCRSLAPVDGQAWYLPAQNELRFLIGALGAKAFQTGQRYWSSSELPGGASVFSVSAELGNAGSGKAVNETHRTRCIRYGT